MSSYYSSQVSSSSLTSTSSSTDSRRDSFNYAGSDARRPSLREMPSFKDEASRALNRREDLAKLKERLSFNRDILHADPSSKPWLRKPSVPIKEGASDASMAYQINTSYSLHTATPVHVEQQQQQQSAPAPRPRNLSRGTSGASIGSEGSYTYDY